MIFNLLKRNKNTIKPGESYAVHGGCYLGEIWICINYKKSTYTFVRIRNPHAYIIDVDDETVKYGIEEKVLRFVDKIPKDIYKFLKNEESNIRRKQSSSQSSLDFIESESTRSDRVEPSSINFSQIGEIVGETFSAE